MTIKLIIFGVFAILSLGANSASTGKQVTIPLKNFKNFQYYADVLVGTPPKPFTVLFSSAGSFFWIPDHSSNSSNTYDPSKSSTSNCKDKKWTFEKGTFVPITGAESTSGLETCSDIVKIGSLTLNKQSFDLANVIDEHWTANYSYPLNGVVGLGLGSEDGVLSAIQKQKLEKNIFSVWLNANTQGTKGGEITFGGINSALYTEPMFYVPLVVPKPPTKKAWKIKVASVEMKSTKLAKDVETFVDMGEGCIKVPQDVLKQISTIVNLDLNSTHSIPCSQASLLPPVTFKIITTTGLKPFTVEAHHYVQPDNGDTCYLCIESYPNNEWSLGAPFMTQFYTVFYAQAQRIAFAKSKDL